MELVSACQNNNTECALQLIDSGIDINYRARQGNAALLWASYKNNTEIVLRLIAAQVDVNQQNEEGNSALLWACHNENLELVSAFIEAQVDVNQQAKDGSTPCHVACRKNNVEILRRLIAAGANINQRTFRGTSSLIIACRSYSLEIFRLLIASGVNINQYSPYGGSALACICTNDEEAPPSNEDSSAIKSTMIIELIKAGANYYDYTETDDIEVQKAFSFNFLEYPIRHQFTLNDTHLLTPENYSRFEAVMQSRSRNQLLSSLPIEIIEEILRKVIE